jgi:hypothetical protein
MLTNIALGLGVVVVGLLGFAATRPDTFRVERSARIEARPEKVFALVEDMRGWIAWSPFEQKDPGMKRAHSGASRGEGAVYEWDGNREIGQGRMEITEVTSPSLVRIKMDFLRPFAAHNIVEFTLQPQGEATRITWAIHGPRPFISKLLGIFLSMDRMIGQDFDKGLGNLKALAEARG